ncbi:hypothetical protein [Pseudoalteromonas undina]|uniref:hypothetical protein n=1 Tax=Pseudoalteromonas undina TaxID=43660 RepID=UPI001866A463|nr:hypothetical protein [Pseudoalteromonas undina]
MFVAGILSFLCGYVVLVVLFVLVNNLLFMWLIPEIDKSVLPFDSMMKLTLAMFGLAELRAIEKLKGASK